MLHVKIKQEADTKTQKNAWFLEPLIRSPSTLTLWKGCARMLPMMVICIESGCPWQHSRNLPTVITDYLSRALVILIKNMYLALFRAYLVIFLKILCKPFCFSLVTLGKTWDWRGKTVEFSFSRKSYPIWIHYKVFWNCQYHIWTTPTVFLWFLWSYDG